jgi:hypothetical protein
MHVQRGVSVGAALQDQGQRLSEITRDLKSCRSEFFSEEQAAQNRYCLLATTTRLLMD